MPTYEYVCTKCDHQFEIFQPMSDAALKVCPKDKCPRRQWGKGAIRRQMGTGAGLIFKGSGFYITDYRSEGYKAAAKKEAGASSSSGADTKAAPKKESSGTGSSGAAAKPGKSTKAGS